MNFAVVKEALYGIKGDSGLVVILEMQRTRSGAQNARFCPSLRARTAARRIYPGQVALSPGLATEARTVALALPSSLRLQAPMTVPP